MKSIKRGITIKVVGRKHIKGTVTYNYVSYINQYRFLR